MVIENEDARLFSSSRQGWKELFKCVRSQQLNAKVLHPLISEYRMIESGRVYYAHRRPLFCLPNRGKIRKKIEPIGSIIRYSIEENHLSAMMIMPSFKETKSHVTILSPNNPFVLTSSQWQSSLDEDNLRQSISKLIRHTSNQDKSIIHHNHPSRLSLRSVSYGFGLGRKTRRKHLTSSPTYHLPANKIELDSNQQEEIIRRTGSLKKSF